MTCSSLLGSSCSPASTNSDMDTASAASNSTRLSTPNSKHESPPLNNDMVVVQQSDFSIDHILHRAGKWLELNHHQPPQEVHHQPIIRDHHHNVDSQTLPIFNWLQYTRYRPPRPQSMYLDIVQSDIGSQTYPRNIVMHTENVHHKPTAKRTPGRLPRVPFSTHQLGVLEDAYKQSSYLSAEEANRLADTLELTNTRVKIWFQNRRARERRERREAETTTTASSGAQSVAFPLAEVSSSTPTSPIRNGSGSSVVPAIVGYHNYLDLSTHTSGAQRMRPFL